MKIYLSIPIYDGIWLTKVLNKINKGRKLDILVSYFYHKKVNLKEIIQKNFDYPYPNVIVDSGAYTAFTKGIEIGIREYSEWLNKCEIDFYFNLDVIGDAKKTKKNQKELENLGMLPVPVYHIQSPISALDDFSEKYNIIGLGGMVPLARRKKELRGNLDRIKKDFSLFHGFGCGSIDMIKRYNWASVDTTSWGTGIRFGMVPIYHNGNFIKLRLGKDYEKWKEHKEIVGNYGFEFDMFTNRDNHTKDDVAELSILSYLKFQDYLDNEFQFENSLSNDSLY